MSIATVLSFLRALPEIIRLVRVIWGSVHENYMEYHRKIRIKKVADAIQKARETKDTSALEKFYNPDGALPDGSVKLPDGPEASVGS